MEKFLKKGIEMAHYKEMEFADLDEGRISKRLAFEFKHLISSVINHRKEFGHKTAKGELALKINVTAVKDSDDLCVTIVQIKTKEPKEPLNITFGQADLSQTDEPCLFVRQSGGDETPPFQGKLFTKDGRHIDTETGNILEESEDDE